MSLLWVKYWLLLWLVCSGLFLGVKFDYLFLSVYGRGSVVCFKWELVWIPKCVFCLKTWVMNNTSAILLGCYTPQWAKVLTIKSKLRNCFEKSCQTFPTCSHPYYIIVSNTEQYRIANDVCNCPTERSNGWPRNYGWLSTRIVWILTRMPKAKTLRPGGLRGNFK